MHIYWAGPKTKKASSTHSWASNAFVLKRKTPSSAIPAKKDVVIRLSDFERRG
jgi:hypothetical protein